MKKAVVFAPHPDDETLSCGGTIAKKLSEGYDVSVVFITDGRHFLSDLGISSNLTSLEIKEIRREEAVEATKVLGIREENLLLLDFEDKTLKKHMKQFQEKIGEILKDISPEEVFFPQEKEYNVDHRATNQTIKKAIESSKLNPVQYQYIIAWSFPFYLLTHLTSEHTHDMLMARFLRLTLIHVDITKYLPLKKMAIEKYKSQTTVISVGQKKPALRPSFLKRFLKNEEKFFVNSSLS